MGDGDGDVDRRVEVHSGGRQEEVQRANTDNADTMPFIKGESPELLCRTGTKLETAPVGKPTMKHHQTGDNNSNQQPNLATRPPTLISSLSNYVARLGENIVEKKER